MWNKRSSLSVKATNPAPKQPVKGGASLEGVSTVEQLARLLSPYFLPASMGTAPLAQGTNGNRRVVLTSDTTYVSQINGQSGSVQLFQATMQALVAGSCTWTYDTPFAKPPIVLAFPIVTAGDVLGLSVAPTTTQATITSTNPGDARTIFIVALETPE